MRNNLTAEYVKSILNYDPDTGSFTWRWRSDVPPEWNTRRSGKVAGTFMKIGYLLIGINDTRYLGHRLAMLITEGRWPDNQIDHINGDRSDNRRANLRFATSGENKWNRGKDRDNRSGFKGVRIHKSSGLWGARITKAGREYSLGYYKTPEEASEAYKAGAVKYHGEFAKW
jgi:hypothetical protein